LQTRQIDYEGFMEMTTARPFASIGHCAITMGTACPMNGLAEAIRYVIPGSPVFLRLIGSEAKWAYATGNANM